MKSLITIVAGFYILIDIAFAQPKLYLEIKGNFDGDNGNSQEVASIFSEKSATANIIVYRIEVKGLPAIRSLSKPDNVYSNKKITGKNKKGENIIKNTIVWVYNKSEGKATEFEYNTEGKYWERRSITVK
ncbi:MAG: hypothetical protein M1426_00625 [Patescibacteria group bacterium]|nr:hypothetical protein [Patescibacteria group bacterium]